MTRESTTNRRTVLRTLSAVGAVAGGTALGGSAAAQEDLSVDADNLVSGNDTFTITLDDLDAGDVSEPTVNVGGISFASVELLEGENAILGINVSNVLGNEAITEQDAVTVAVSAVIDGTRVSGTDESHVISTE